MKPATGRTVCLALTLAVLALALSYASVYGQFRGGMPGQPGFRGGMPPGFPNGGMSGRGMGISGMPGMPGGQFTGMRGGFTGGGFTGGGETVWECGKCKYVLGRGPVKPRVMSCPQCGVRFVNGMSPGMAAPGRFRPPFGGGFPPSMPNQPGVPGGNMPPGMQPPGGFPNNQPPGGQPPQLPTEPPPGANPEPPQPAQPPVPAAGEQPPAPAGAATSNPPPSSKSSSSKTKWIAIAFAVGIILVGIVVLAGAALLVYSQKKSAAPRRKRRRPEYD